MSSKRVQGITLVDHTCRTAADACNRETIMDVRRFKRQHSRQHSQRPPPPPSPPSGRKRPFGVIQNEFIVPARVQAQRMMPVWMAKVRWLVLRGSKTPILAVYRQISGFVTDENPLRVMLLGADTSVQVAGEKSMVIVSSRVRRNDTWTLAFESSGQRKRMYELVKMWIELSAFLQTLTGFESLSKSNNSVVYRCRDRDDPARCFALKRVSRAKCWNEIEVTEHVAHVEPLQPYLARYLFLFEDSKDNSVTIVMKHYPGGSLSDRIREHGPLGEGIVRSVLSSLCLALFLLHRQDVLHLDVKAGNILFDAESSRSFRNLKLVDFGSSVFAAGGDRPITTSGTFGCMAPERFDGRLGPAADVYGAGVVLFHMVVGEIPFAGKDSYQIMAKNMQGRVSFESPRWRRVSRPLRHLAERMLERDPDRRIGLDEILKLPWLYQPQSKLELVDDEPAAPADAGGGIARTLDDRLLLRSSPFAFFA